MRFGLLLCVLTPLFYIKNHNDLYFYKLSAIGIESINPQGMLVMIHVITIVYAREWFNVLKKGINRG